MSPGFQFEVLYQDQDLVKLRVAASNGVFSGGTDVYLGIGELGKLASKIQGFPNLHSDIREITLGDSDPEAAGGDVTMRFYCSGGAVHAYVQAKIQSAIEKGGILESVILEMPIEAAAVDSFAESLHQLEQGQSTIAYLHSVP